MNFRLSSPQKDSELYKFASKHSLTIHISFLTNVVAYFEDQPNNKVYVETIVKSPLETIYESLTDYSYSDDELLKIIKPIILDNKINNILDEKMYNM